MESIIQKICNDFGERNPHLPKQSKEQDVKETLSHDAVFKTLSKEQVPLFNNFVDCLLGGTCETNELMFRYGFKTAILLMIEVFSKD